jgi:hypothetical protein
LASSSSNFRSSQSVKPLSHSLARSLVLQSPNLFRRHVWSSSPKLKCTGEQRTKHGAAVAQNELSTMELNESHAKPPEEPSRAMPFHIDLNEPPLSAGDLSPGPPSPVNSAGASRGRAALLDINAAPPSEAEGDECVQSMSSGYGIS